MGRLPAEVHCSCALLLIAMSLVLPPAIKWVLRTFQTPRAEAAAHQLVGYLQEARRRAVVEKVRFRVAFTPKGSAFTLQRQDQPADRYRDVAKYRLSPGATFTDVPSALEFNPAGTVRFPAQLRMRYKRVTRIIEVTAKGSMRVRAE